ncbi:hypothetical protein ELQ35_01730 [Peribacillus cavernae]|uniref:Uncharacterized protein n=1 Tax=Peribacillus cavernae TaxID=1674310 RepID=A0A433HX48_9BACI|nr:hypothetical protein ELQ35_01730 [Peribacillus cavernae]
MVSLFRRRGNKLNSEPVISGAESFIAGTSSCRIEVEGVDELYRRIQPLGILWSGLSHKRWRPLLLI